MNIPLEQLKHEFPHKFPLYMCLLHNALISYRLLPESSVSFPDRPDVIHFAEFCKPHLHKRVLDVGIGSLLIPGYYKGTDEFELIGIDVIEYNDTAHIMEACAEFMPFPDNFCDVVVYGTSLDHLCDIARGLKETYRVLKPDGHVLVWMADTSHIKPMQGIVEIQGIYFCVPPNAHDPFHSTNESTKETIERFEFIGFKLEELSEKNKNEVFMRFTKCNYVR